jgi:hypothetical protein
VVKDISKNVSAFRIRVMNELIGLVAMNRLERNAELKTATLVLLWKLVWDTTGSSALYFEIKDKPNLTKTTLLVAFSAVTSEALLLADDPNAGESTVQKQ